jgi:hypothetical protein
MAFELDARVVVVDDDPFFVEAMLVLLPQLGLAPVACALHGAEAIVVVMSMPQTSFLSIWTCRSWTVSRRSRRSAEPRRR